MRTIEHNKIHERRKYAEISNHTEAQIRNSLLFQIPRNNSRALITSTMTYALETATINKEQDLTIAERKIM